MLKIFHDKKKNVMISVGHRRNKIQVKLVKIGPLIDNIIIIIIMMMMMITIITIVISLLLYYSLLISICIAYIL